MPIAELISVELREAWPDETADFTPWLARNLPRMLEELGLAHDIVGTERQVGRYRADIVFTDEETGELVLVENQLTRTDHNHLGQLLTYAAGLEAVTVIWVAQSFTEEHRAVLDWLNEHTTDDLSFIGIEVELWRIGTSDPAPRFNVVAKPNGWTRSMRKVAAAHEDLSDTRVMQIEYWRALHGHIEKAGGPCAMTDRDRPRGYATFGVGRTGFVLSAVMLRMQERIRAELYIKGQNAEHYFRGLRGQSEPIHSELGYELEWEELPDGSDCRIAVYLDADPDDREDWNRQHSWLTERLNELHKAFSNRVRALPDREETLPGMATI